MKKVIRVVAIVIGVCIVVGAFFAWGVRSYIAKVRQVHGEIRLRYDTAECSAMLRKPDAELHGISRLRLGLSGVPDEKHDAAFNAVVQATCSCVMKTKGDERFAAFSVNPSNKPRIASCINEGFARAEKLYVSP